MKFDPAKTLINQGFSAEKTARANAHFESALVMTIFDSPPYISTVFRALRKCKKNTQEQYEILKFDPAKTLINQGFSAEKNSHEPTRISSQSRYDHFDTAPYLSQHQHLGKRGELMGRTSKNIKLRIPEKPHKIKGFRSGSYRVATTISSHLRFTPLTYFYRISSRIEESRDPLISQSFIESRFVNPEK
ncbi:MAG: hypothetical protein ACLS3C_16280 [Oscillospiraceae bacterium]